MQITHFDHIANGYICDVDFQCIWQVLNKTANFNYTSSLAGLTTILQTNSSSCKLDRNLHCYRLVLKYLNEIDVDQFIIYRVELQILHNCLVLFTIEDYFNDIGIGCIDHVPEIILVGVEVKYFCTSVHDAGNVIDFSKVAGRFFTQLGALYSVD